LVLLCFVNAVVYSSINNVVDTQGGVEGLYGGENHEVREKEKEDILFSVEG
jgi:hypothetical protein